jgi:hypothetical protein
MRALQRLSHWQARSSLAVVRELQLARRLNLNPPEEFLKHAADCEKMARSTRDPRSSATWHRMAERWRQCAEKFTRESLAANNHTLTRHRKPEPGWARH